MSRSWAGGSTRAWRTVRARVLLANLDENRGLCRLDVGRHCPRHGRPCPNVCTGRATHVHHTRGKRYGDDQRHLVAACADCNRHVGNPADARDPTPKPMTRW